MNKTQARVQMVLERIMAHAALDAEAADAYSAVLGEMLIELNYGDFFGTEGQSDPRGDQRDAEWSMTRVQGVDQ